MTPVSWATLEPGQTERVIGILLASELGDVTRLRPGRGDGGIDVVHWIDRANKIVDVYQVKYFATNLGDSEKRQIKASLQRVKANRSVVVRNWYLAVPLNPTPGNLEWLDKLRTTTVGVPFPCAWFGLDRVDSLAAKHQDVIDYYLGDGASKVAQAIADLRALVDLDPAGKAPLIPAEASERLAKVYDALNRHDPHYRYEIELTAAPPPPERLQPRTGLVATLIRSDSRGAVTHHIFEKYRGADEDAPIPFAFNIQRARFDKATEEEWDSAIRYGTPVSLPHGTVTDLVIDAPGGLATTAAEASIRLSPADGPTRKPYRLRLRLLDPDGAVVAKVVLDMEPPTTGLLLPGIRASGVESGGAFEVEMLADEDPDGLFSGRVNIRVRDLVGLAPAALVAGIRFLAAAKAPNRLQFAPEYGPPATQTFVIPAGDAPAPDALVESIEALADLQEHLAGDLRVPDLDQLSPRAHYEIARAARLVRGETLRDTWDEVELTLERAPSTSIEGTVQLAVAGELKLAFDDQTVVVRPITIVWMAAELTVEGARIKGRPALGNNTRLTRLTPIEDVPPQPLQTSDPESGDAPAGSP